MHHHNFHAGFSPQNNDPSSQFYSIQQDYALLDALTWAITDSVSSPRRCHMIDVEREYQEASHMLASATQDHERIFYQTILERLIKELSMMLPDRTTDTAGNDGSNN